MSQKYGLDKIDLSSLPAGLREKVQAQLNQMTPEKQKEFLQKAQPMLNRAKDAVKQVDTRRIGAVVDEVDDTGKSLRAVLEKARHMPHGHYNQTIRPGDRHSFPWIKISIIALIAYLIYSALTVG